MVRDFAQQSPPQFVLVYRRMAPPAVLYNRRVKTWDVAIIGAGVIGLSLAWRLRREEMQVLVVEKAEPSREATYSAGGMIANCDPHNPPQLREMIALSARIYPEFVRELRADGFESPDYRPAGAILFAGDDETAPVGEGVRALTGDDIAALDPKITARGRAFYLPEASVDPRKLGSALERAARNLGVDFVTGSPVIEVALMAGRAAGVRTAKTLYAAGTVINCAGAWASLMRPFGQPTRPIKGQMVSLVPPAHQKSLIQHVVRSPEVYMIPRSDGRILLGATVEDIGFDKRVDPAVVQNFQHAAANIVPAIADMRLQEAWAGLRPGTPDGLPILGATSLRGYYAATGHFRDGIMLAPATARLMTQLLTRQPLECDLAAFSPLRFA
jgi:glycine oxidase